MWVALASRLRSLSAKGTASLHKIGRRPESVVVQFANAYVKRRSVGFRIIARNKLT